MTQANLAFVFPGQGSQALEMLKDSWDNPVVEATFNEADAALGFSLSEMIKTGTAEDLGKTEITQPALLTVSIALYRLWIEKTGKTPALVAGHSLGEYSALVAAGAIAFKDAVKLVSLRGQFMQTAVPAGTGGMAAIIGMDDDAVIALCQEISNDGAVSAVNFNSPGQVVIAGEKAAVDAACELAKEKGARRALPLPVSVPSHCILMKPAADKLAVELDAIEINAPTIPVIHNVDVKAHNDAEAIKEALITQLYQPVRWTETVAGFADQGIENVVECGSGKVLTGLIRRIDKSLTLFNLSDGASLQNVIESMDQ